MSSFSTNPRKETGEKPICSLSREISAFWKVARGECQHGTGPPRVGEHTGTNTSAPG